MTRVTRIFDNYPPEFREACATHEFFRKLGYPAENLFIHLREDGMLMVVLRHGGKQFAVNINWTKLTQEELETKWPELIIQINNHEVSQEELDAVWYNSYIFTNKVLAVAAMVSKGFKPANNFN